MSHLTAIRRSGRISAALSLAVTLSASLASAGVHKPGSALLFPIQHDGEARMTIVSVTNTNTTPQTPNSFGGSTRVHYEYLTTTPTPGQPLKPSHCVVNNRYEFLTPADTLSVRVKCHNPVDLNQGGYMVASAVSPTGGTWSHNYLAGSMLVLYPSGASYTMNAIPFKAMTGEGYPTDLNGNARLDFDGREYEGISDQLFIDSFVAAGQQNLTLLSLTGRSSDLHRVGLSIWNDNEFPLSTTLEFKCWFNQPLARLSSLFTDTFLKHATPDDPGELDYRCNGVGLLETGWVRIDSLGVTTVGGFPVDSDGALAGALTSNRASTFTIGRALWGSDARQFNGSAVNP